MTNNIPADIQSLAPDAVIELFEIDLTPFGDVVYRYHFGTNELKQNVVWDGETYTAWAGKAAGFNVTTSGQTPRPKIALGNLLGTITAMCILFNDCVGAKVRRIRTLKKYLDAVNFDGGVNDDADPTAMLPVDIFFINRKTSETNEAVEFELAAAYDVTGVMLPRRQIVQNLCPWRYRGGECGYAGPPIADRNDNYFTTTDATSAEEETLISAFAAIAPAKALMQAAALDLANKSLALEAAGASVMIDDFYNVGVGTKYFIRFRQDGSQPYTLNGDVVFGGSNVTIGDTYRQGDYVGDVAASDGVPATKHYRIQRWAVDSTALAAAQADYDASETAYNGTVSDYNDALDAYDAAIAALPSDSPLYARDVCGKRLASCKLRFGADSELPFGGFPGAGLIG